jgi:hypothetical protein
VVSVGGFRAIMVLLVKQTHLQKEVADVRAAKVGTRWVRRERRRRRVGGRRMVSFLGGEEGVRVN